MYSFGGQPLANVRPLIFLPKFVSWFWRRPASLPQWGQGVRPRSAAQATGGIKQDETYAISLDSWNLKELWYYGRFSHVRVTAYIYIFIYMLYSMLIWLHLGQTMCLLYVCSETVTHRSSCQVWQKELTLLLYIRWYI